MSDEATAKIKALIVELRQQASWIKMMNREPTEDNMRPRKPDDDQGYKRVYEVSAQLDKLEYCCGYLLGTIMKLEKRCDSVLSYPAVDGEDSGNVPQPTLCPLAARLRRFARHIETACGRIDMIVGRMEL